MHIIWNGLLSKAVALQEQYGNKDLRFFGVSFGWIGIGVLIGVDKSSCDCEDPLYMELIGACMRIENCKDRKKGG